MEKEGGRGGKRRGRDGAKYHLRKFRLEGEEIGRDTKEDREGYKGR